MSEKHEHRRDSEDDEFVHARRDDFIVPDSAKWIAAFINRIGFPIFAFCLLSYFYFVGLKQNTQAILDLKEVMISVRASLDARR